MTQDFMKELMLHNNDDDDVNLDKEEAEKNRMRDSVPNLIIDQDEVKRKTEGLAQGGLVYRKKATRTTIVPSEDIESNEDTKSSNNESKTPTTIRADNGRKAIIKLRDRTLDNQSSLDSQINEVEEIDEKSYDSESTQDDFLLEQELDLINMKGEEVMVDQAIKTEFSKAVIGRDNFEKDLLLQMNRQSTTMDDDEEFKDDDDNGDNPEQDYIQIVDQSEHLFISYA
jgi:hypothetical protein